MASKEEVTVTYNDQQKINTYAKANLRMRELKQEREEYKKRLQNIEDAGDELMLLDDEESHPIMVGEAFIHMNGDRVTNRLDAEKEKVESKLESTEEEIKKITGEMLILKEQLYAKFKDKINLEESEE